MQYIYNTCKVNLTYTCRNRDQVVNVSHTKKKVPSNFYRLKVTVARWPIFKLQNSKLGQATAA
jgi:hypothetical protein